MSNEKQRKTTLKDERLPAIPDNLPEELLPLYDWWKTKGVSSLTTLAVALILVGAVFGLRNYRQTRAANASQELLKAASLEELEGVVAKYGSTKAGNTARIRLAKAYYDASNYHSALQTYEEFLKRKSKNPFREIAVLGRAQALEGLNRLDEALSVFQDFAKNHPEHFLYAQAVMGSARVLTLLERRGEALNVLEKLKAEKTADVAVEMAVARLEGIVNRYEPRTVPSLFEMADEAAATLPPSATTPVPPVSPAPASEEE